MKRLLTVLILSTLVLAGCGAFRSHHAWKQAKQEDPLQIPPSLDHPSTAAALTIPPPSGPASQATSSTSTKAAPPKSAANATQMHLPGDVDKAYKRVGLVLQQGDLGTVAAQDAAQHTYQLRVNTKSALGASQSFLQKHFSNLQKQQGSSTGDSGSAPGQGTVTVVLKVTPAQGGGSTVNASGDPQQAVHVISVLNSRLGG